MEQRFDLLKKITTNIIDKVKPKIDVDGDIEITYGSKYGCIEARIKDTYFLIYRQYVNDRYEIFTEFSKYRKFDISKECYYGRNERFDILSLAPKLVLIFLAKDQIRYHLFEKHSQTTLSCDDDSYVISNYDVAFTFKKEFEIPDEIFRFLNFIRYNNACEISEQALDNKYHLYDMYGIDNFKELFDYSHEDSESEILEQIFDDDKVIEKIDCPICFMSVPINKSFKPSCSHYHCQKCSSKITKCSLCRKDF
jgi:hypothetical protein